MILFIIFWEINQPGLVQATLVSPMTHAVMVNTLSAKEVISAGKTQQLLSLIMEIIELFQMASE